MSIRRVSPKEAQALLAEGYVYVDVRSIEEWEAGHPAGSQNLPLLLRGATGLIPNPDFVAIFGRTYSKDAKIVIGCKAGGRSKKAIEMLEPHGYTQLIDQRAGYDGVRDAFGQLQEAGWAEEGLPTASGGGAGAYAELSRR